MQRAPRYFEIVWTNQEGRGRHQGERLRKSRQLRRKLENKLSKASDILPLGGKRDIDVIASDLTVRKIRFDRADAVLLEQDGGVFEKSQTAGGWDEGVATETHMGVKSIDSMDSGDVPHKS